MNQLIYLIISPRPILPSVNRPILEFDKIEIVGLASELHHIDWSIIFSINDHVEHAWNKFSQNIAIYTK